MGGVMQPCVSSAVNVCPICGKPLGEDAVCQPCLMQWLAAFVPDAVDIYESSKTRGDADTK